MRSTYTHLHALLASPAEPTPLAQRLHQLTRMHQGLHALTHDERPSTDDWRVCSDAVNLLETLVSMGELEDGSGLLADAVAALAKAGQRHMAGGPLRLDAQGLQAVKAVLDDYAGALEALSHRTMIVAHRATEKRISALLRGQARPSDVVLVKI